MNNTEKKLQMDKLKVITITIAHLSKDRYLKKYSNFKDGFQPIIDALLIMNMNESKKAYELYVNPTQESVFTVEDDSTMDEVWAAITDPNIDVVDMGKCETTMGTSKSK